MAAISNALMAVLKSGDHVVRSALALNIICGAFLKSFLFFVVVFAFCRVRNYTFLVANATKNQVLAIRISQVVASTQLTLQQLTMMCREND